MDSMSLYPIIDSAILIALIALSRLTSSSLHLRRKLSLLATWLHNFRRACFVLALLALFLLAGVWTSGPSAIPNASTGANPARIHVESAQPYNLAEYSGALNQSQTKSYPVSLTQAHVYDFALDVLTTNTSVDFELSLYTQSGGLVDYTSHNPVTQGISVSLDEYIQSSMNYNIVVTAVTGSANYTLWIFDNTIGTPQYSGTFSDPAAHMESYEKSGGDLYLVYLEQYVSYDIQLTNKPVFTDFQLQITDLLGNAINSTHAPAGVDNALDLYWSGLTGYYFVKVAKGPASPITASGGYVLGVYRLYLGDVGMTPNTPFNSPLYKKLVANQTGDIYDLLLRQNFAYSFELQGFPSTSNFQLRIIDPLGHILANSSFASPGKEVSLGLPWTQNTGTYYIQVFRVSGTGNYELTVWSLNLGAPATQPIPAYTGSTSPSGKKLLANSNGDYYLVWLDQLVSYDIDMTGKSSSANLQFQVLDNTGKSFYNSSIPVGQDGSIDFIWKYNSGFYYIRVFGKASSGPYTLTAWRLFVGDPQQPTTSPSSKTILANDTGDIYTVYFTQTMPYDINLFPTINGNMTVKITDQLNTVLYSNQTTNGQDLSLDFVWTRLSGYYFVSILKQAGTGPYQAEFWKMNIASISAPTTFTKSFLPQDSYDIVSITLDSGIAYDFELIKPTGAALDLRLTDIYGTIIASTNSPPGVDVSLNYVNSRPGGLYYLKILRNDTSTGQYTLRLWRMDLGAPSTAGTSSFMGKQILSNDTGDVYSVYLQQGYSYGVDLQMPSTSNFQIEVLDTFNNVLFGPTKTQTGQSTSLDFIWQNAAGEGYLKIMRVNGTGSYTLTIWSLYVGSPGMPSLSPSNVQILANDTGDVYTLYLTQGYSYSFDLFQPWGASLELRLVNAQGTPIAGPTVSPPGQSVSLDLILSQASGLYYLQVIHVSGSGAYTLKMWGLYLVAPSTPTIATKAMASNDSGDIYSLYLTQSYSYDFNLYKPSGSSLELSLTNSTGSTLFGPTSSSGVNTVSLDFILQRPTGIYYLHVLRASGAGSYTLKLWTLSLSIPGTSPQGEDLAGVDSLDIYTVALTANLPYEFNIINLPSNAHFELSLVNASGTVFYSSSTLTGLPASLSFIWRNQSGLYYLRIIRVSGYGSYTLQARSPSLDLTSLSGGTLIDTIYQNDSIAAVSLQSSGIYDIEMRALPSDARFGLQLLAPSGAIVLQSLPATGTTGGFSFRWNGTTATAFVRVMRISGSGTFTLYGYNNNLGHPSSSPVAAANHFLSDSNTGALFKAQMDANYTYALVFYSSNYTLTILNSTTGSAVSGPFGAGTIIWRANITATYYFLVGKSPGQTSADIYSLYVGQLSEFTLKIVDPPSNGYIGSNFMVLIQAQDPVWGVTQVQFRIDNGNWQPAYLLTQGYYYAQIDTAAIGEGPHRITVQAVDGAGVTVKQTTGFTIDLTPPIARLVAATPSANLTGVIYITNQTKLTLNVTDLLSGVKAVYYRINSGTWLTYSSDIYIRGQDGSYTLQYYAIDRVGNQEPLQSRNMYLDNTPPTVSFISPQAGESLNSGTVTIDWSGTDGGSGVGYYMIKIDSGTYTNLTTGTSYSANLPNGNHVVTLLASDKVGNSKTYTLNFSVAAASSIAPTGDLTLIVGASLVGLAIILFLLIRRRRRHQEEEILEAGFPGEKPAQAPTRTDGHPEE